MSANVQHATKPPHACPRCGSTTLRGRALARMEKQQRQHEAFLSRLAALSEREREVILLIARGVMPATIAEVLSINVRTVGTYRARALEKLEMLGTADIAVAAYKAGLIE